MLNSTGTLPDAPTLRAGVAAGGASRMWEHVIANSLAHIERAVPAGSRVLEVGYGDGELTCWLAARFGWRIVGVDVTPNAHASATAAVRRYRLDGQIELRLLPPSETRLLEGQYDAVFIKTVLYSSVSLLDYAAWLDWILSVLKPGGILVNYETGRANHLVQAYRRLRGRAYADLSLYTGGVENLYDERFSLRYREYHGGLSQFVSPLVGLYEICRSLEGRIAPRSADNCFIVSMVLAKAV